MLKYPITRFTGIIVIGLSIYFLSSCWRDLIRAIKGEYFDEIWLLALILIGILFSTGVGLIFRQKWARILFVIFLVLFLLIWIFMAEHISVSRGLSTTFIVKSTFFFTIEAFLVYLLYNKKLNDEFDEKMVEELDETLDSQLFRESDSVS
jgi:hypothetical protein